MASTLHSAVISAPTLWLPGLTSTPAKPSTSVGVASSTPPQPSFTNTGVLIQQTSISNGVVTAPSISHLVPYATSSGVITGPAIGKSVEQHIDIPEVISGVYKKDYNILYVDQVIHQKLQQEISNLGRLKFQLSQLNNLLESSANIVAYRTRQAEISQLSKLITDIESGQRTKTYVERSHELIEWYRTHHQSVNMVNIHQTDSSDDLHSVKRLLVIEEYLEIANDYISIQVTRTYDSRTNQCHGCSMDLSKVTANMDGQIICPRPCCRTVHNMETNLRMPEIGDHVANYSSGKDESIENFYKAAQRFQAEQTAHIPPAVYQKLEEYFVKQGCPPAAVVRTQALNSRGWRGNTSVQMLRNALDEIGESALGKHTILIGKNYWGWQPMKISEYMEQITADYHETQTVFHTIPAELRGRDSSLGTEYRLWRHLQLRGCQCYFDMFMIAGEDSLDKHENIWKMMCEGATSPHIKFINSKDPLPLTTSSL